MIPQKCRPLIFISVILVALMMPVLIEGFNSLDQAISKRPEQPAIAPVDNTSYYEIMDWIIDGTHESDMLFAGFNYSVFVNIKNLDTLNHSNLVLTLLSNSSDLTMHRTSKTPAPVCLRRKIKLSSLATLRSKNRYQRGRGPS